MSIETVLYALQNDSSILLPYPIHESAFLIPSTIPFSAEVRKACEANLCGMYGKCWTCPPGVGLWEELREHYHSYAHAFVFTTVHPLEDSYDIEGMTEGRKQHTDAERAIEKLLFYGSGAVCHLWRRGMLLMRKMHVSERTVSSSGACAPLHGGNRDPCRHACGGLRHPLPQRREYRDLFFHHFLVIGQAHLHGKSSRSHFRVRYVPQNSGCPEMGDISVRLLLFSEAVVYAFICWSQCFFAKM